MRRGLMAWSREEIGADVFERRIGALVAGLRGRGWDCLLAYTDFARPAAVSSLTHFIPYWGSGVLVVTPATGALLVATMSRRVADWMHSTARLDGLVNTLDLGNGVAEAVARVGSGALHIGVVDLASLPCGIAAAIRKMRPEATFEDASDLHAAVLAAEPAPGGKIEVQCRAIAETALRAGIAAATAGEANAMLAAAEGAAREAGAEEILLALAPDCAIDARLRRIEGGAPLGALFALQVSVAYKGCWSRLARTASAGALPPWVSNTDAWFAAVSEAVAAGAPAGTAIEEALPLLAGAELESWHLEAAQDGLALAVVAGSPPFMARAVASDIPAGLLTLSLRLRLPAGVWFAASPVRIKTAAAASA